MSSTKTFPDIAVTAGIFGVLFGIIYTVLLGYRVLFTNGSIEDVTFDTTFMFISFALYTFAVIFLVYAEIWSSPAITGKISVVLNFVYFFFGVLPLSYLFISRSGSDQLATIIFRFIFLLVPFIAHSIISYRYIHDNYLVEVEPPSSSVQ